MSGFATLSKYWHTVRYLRPVQVTARARHALLKPPRIDAAAHAAPRVRPTSGVFTPAAERAASMTGPNAFVFLNQLGQIQSAACWNDPAHTKLWLYNLHYFDDLNASGAAERETWHRDLIARWLAENPPQTGNGWEPYPLSLRIVNWIKWSLAGNGLTAQATASLSLQAASLDGQIEWHLLGNHLLANAKALTFAGCFFESAEAEQWLRQGLAIYERELPEQILPDGGHFERSPMYHSIILEDLLDIINVGRVYPGTIPQSMTGRLEDICVRMLRWLEVMSHPDGQISFFNDGAFGIAPPPTALLGYARRLGLSPSAGHHHGGIIHLDPSGYVRCERAGAVLICDCAPVGPDYLPGHAHADTLSFELSLGSDRVIVNGGTSVYGTGARRAQERGTAAHSTVVIDGADSSEVWSGFRVARRARVFGVRAEESSGASQVSASHDGYRRLRGRNIHTREWTLSERELTVQDHVTGPCKSAVARFHLGPGVTATVEPSGIRGTLRTAGGHLADWHAQAASTIAPSQWNPEFGKTIATHCIDVPLRNGEGLFTLRWRHGT